MATDVEERVSDGWHTVQLPELCEPPYLQRGVNDVTTRMLNLYIDRSPYQKGKSTLQLRHAPGLKLFGTVANNAAARGVPLMNSSVGNVFYSVHSNRIYRIQNTSEFAATEIYASVNTTFANVYMAENNTQVLVVDGNGGHIITKSNHNVAAITDENFPSSPIGATYMDGYFIVVEGGTSKFWLSQINSGMNWTPVQFATAEAEPDFLQFVIAHKQFLYLIGRKTIEVWVSSEGGSFPFVRLPSGVHHIGTWDDATVAARDGFVFFTGGHQEPGSVWMMQGMSLKRISTPIIEEATANAPGRFGFCYYDKSMLMYHLGSDGSSPSYVYNATLDHWFENGLDSSQHVSRAIVNQSEPPNNRPLVVSKTNGRVYELLSEYNQFDLGETPTAIPRLRTFGPVHGGRNRVFHTDFRIDMTILFDDASTGNVAITLEKSDNGGATFTTISALTKSVTNRQRVQFEWRRLGASRERYYRISYSGAFQAFIHGAEARLLKGAF